MKSAGRFGRKVWWGGVLAALIVVLCVLVRPRRGATEFPPLDVLAEFQALTAAGEGETEAWPLYDEALRKLGDPQAQLQVMLACPGDPRWSEARALAERNTEAIDLLMQAAACDVYGMRPFPPSSSREPRSAYATLAVAPTPNLLEIRGLANLLCLDAEVAMEDGDPARAVDAWIAVGDLSQQLCDRPLMIDQMIGSAIRAIARERLTPHLVMTGWQWPDELLERLQRSTLCDTAVPDMERQMAGEWLWVRAVVQDTFDDGSGRPGALRRDRVSLMAASGATGLSGIESALADVRAVWRTFRHADYDDTWRELIRCRELGLAAARGPSPHLALDALGDTFDRYGGFWDSGRYQLVALLDPAGRTRSLAKAWAQFQAGVHGTRILVDLVRYFRDHGRWPTALADLPPTASRAPAEPFHGGPLLYRPTTHNNGFVLYWPGWDGVDQCGGDVRRVAGADDFLVVPVNPSTFEFPSR